MDPDLSSNASTSRTEGGVRTYVTIPGGVPIDQWPRVVDTDLSVLRLNRALLRSELLYLA